MFTPKSPLPPGVERDRLYRRTLFDTGKTTFDLFPSNPDGSESEQNYDQIPLATDKNVVFLGLSITPNHSILVEDANIDPQKVLNCLTDGILKITTNQKRTTELRYPIKDVLNLSNIQTSNAYDSTSDATFLTATLSATGIRPLDELFYVKKNESWSMELKFNNANFPAQANWPNAPFGVFAEIPIAKMDDDQLEKYKRRYNRDRGYGG